MVELESERHHEGFYFLCESVNQGRSKVEFVQDYVRRYPVNDIIQGISLSQDLLISIYSTDCDERTLDERINFASEILNFFLMRYQSYSNALPPSQKIKPSLVAFL